MKFLKWFLLFLFRGVNLSFMHSTTELYLVFLKDFCILRGCLAKFPRLVSNSKSPCLSLLSNWDHRHELPYLT